MANFLRFQLENGKTIDFEVVAIQGGKVRAARGDEIVAEAQQKLETALGTVRSVTSAVLAQLTDFPQSPAEVEIEFGCKIVGEVGAVIAKASTEGHFLVKLKWQRGNAANHAELGGPGQ
jgi:hypothetical protein